METPEVQVAKAQHLAAHAAASHGVHSAGLYSGHYGLPAIGHDGTPLDTPEVQLAKHAHFAAYHEAAARTGYHHGAYAVAPVETPEVQHAKALHFAAHAEANARLSHHGHYRKRRSAYYHVPVIGHDGVPVDTPEVQAAKAHHFAAHAAISHHSAPVVSYAPQHDYTPHHYTGPIHIPVIDHNGVPVETPEVQHAKAEHAAAHAKSHGGAYTAYGGHYSAPVSAYSGHYAVPAIGHDGTPLDTPEVQAAKAAHFAAHSKAQGHYY